MTHNYLIIGSKLKKMLMDAGRINSRGQWILSDEEYLRQIFKQAMLKGLGIHTEKINIRYKGILLGEREIDIII